METEDLQSSPLTGLAVVLFIAVHVVGYAWGLWAVVKWTVGT